MRASTGHSTTVVAGVALCALFLVTQATAEIVVPFGAEHRYAFYTYQYAEIWDNVPFEVDEIDFDDSTWSLGSAPFGAASGSCAFLPATAWELEDDIIVVRVKFFLPAGAGDAHINVWHSDDYNISVDGVRRAWVHQFQIDCPYASHIHVYQLDTSVAGDHVIVIYSRSNGPWGGDEPHQYLNMEIRAPLPSPVTTERWGCIKALFR